ncbi:MAG: hypothetical protein HKN74_13275 [Acidimicrobiia bacterium]|nr:hypothetical protein [Acidimicrobiia bacterium]NNL68981.1 hypothetical protein [Acidimicrobiia bacterium]
MGFIVAASVLVAGIATSVRLLVSPDALADGSAALVAISVMVASAVSVVGLVMVRARWARRLGLGLMAGQLALALTLEFSIAGWVALGATATCLMLLLGPWLDGFLRRLPAADPLPPASMMLAIALVFVPAGAGVSAPAGPRAMHWVAAGAALLVAWGYARAVSAGLWGARLAVPAALVAAAVQSPPGGAVVLVVLGGALAVLAWLPGSAQAVRPLIPSAPGVAVPPELVPPELLAKAGYDERGRPRKKPGDVPN